MKRIAAFLLCVILLFCTSACSGSQGNELVSVTKSYESNSLHQLTKRESQKVISFITKGTWGDGTLPDCISDVWLFVPGYDRILSYHSHCGTFSDIGGLGFLFLSEKEKDSLNKILEQYITLGPVLGDPMGTYDWGITLTIKDVTPEGATLICTQSGGSPTGTLTANLFYVLERNVNEDWELIYPTNSVGYFDQNLEITGRTKEWIVDWEYEYGTLPPGTYRIGKVFTDLRDSGDFDEMIVYAEFEIE